MMRPGAASGMNECECDETFVPAVVYTIHEFDGYDCGMPRIRVCLRDVIVEAGESEPFRIAWSPQIIGREDHASA